MRLARHAIRKVKFVLTATIPAMALLVLASSGVRLDFVAKEKRKRKTTRTNARSSPVPATKYAAFSVCSSAAASYCPTHVESGIDDKGSGALLPWVWELALRKVGQGRGLGSRTDDSSESSAVAGPISVP